MRAAEARRFAAHYPSSRRTQRRGRRPRRRGASTDQPGAPARRSRAVKAAVGSLPAVRRAVRAGRVAVSEDGAGAEHADPLYASALEASPKSASCSRFAHAAERGTPRRPRERSAPKSATRRLRGPPRCWIIRCGSTVDRGAEVGGASRLRGRQRRGCSRCAPSDRAPGPSAPRTTQTPVVLLTTRPRLVSRVLKTHVEMALSGGLLTIGGRSSRSAPVGSQARHGHRALATDITEVPEMMRVLCQTRRARSLSDAGW